MAGRRWVPGPRPEGCEHWMFPMVAPDDPRLRGVADRANVMAFDDNGWPVFAFSDRGTPMCGAPTKRGPCQAVERNETGRCRLHDGTGIVAARAAFDLARNESYIPRLGQRVQRALSDPELVSARKAIATYEGLIEEVGESIGRGSSEAWDEAVVLWQGLMDAVSSEFEDGLPEAVERASRALADVFDERFENKRKEVELRRLMTEQLAHKREERELMRAKEQFVTPRQLKELQQVLAHVVKDSISEHVEDPTVRSLLLGSIQSRLARAFGVEPGQ